MAKCHESRKGWLHVDIVAVTHLIEKEPHWLSISWSLHVGALALLQSITLHRVDSFLNVFERSHLAVPTRKNETAATYRL